MTIIESLRWHKIRMHTVVVHTFHEYFGSKEFVCRIRHYGEEVACFFQVNGGPTISIKIADIKRIERYQDKKVSLDDIAGV